MRKILGDLIEESDRFHVVATARDGLDALDKIEEHKPQVVTLDIEMPRMNGLTALEEIVRKHQLPVVLVSSLTTRGAKTTLKGLSLGAVDFLAKPEKLFGGQWDDIQKQLIQKLRGAYKARTRMRVRRTAKKLDAPKKKRPRPKKTRTTRKQQKDKALATKLLAVGASTGGPPALETLFSSLPVNNDTAVMVTQHMPPGFTQSLAERLNRLVAWHVVEASADQAVNGGTVYIAPGGHHLKLTRDKQLELDSSPPVHHVRPSVDIMFKSIARHYDGPVCGVILTGMGKDGAEGLRALRGAGAKTVAESEETCVIFGMPKAALDANAVQDTVGIDEMADYISRWMT
jgi:two-component system chemotaxis response regulator CheB